jgi:DNA-binding response OmpR family regulator
MARILLIEDDDSVRYMLGQTLTHFGHTVIEARNGKEGLELFQSASADLVITDIVMPEKEGLEVLMALRKEQPPVKIIAMSGGGRGVAADYLRAAKLMGAAKVLTKPFSTDVLIAAINEVLSAGPASAQPAEAPDSRLGHGRLAAAEGELTFRAETTDRSISFGALVERICASADDGDED